MAFAAVTIDVITQRAVGQINKLKTASAKLDRSFKVLEKRNKGITTQFGKLGKIIGTVAIAEFGRRSVNAAANFDKLNLRLKLLTEQTGTFAESQKIAADAQKLFGISTLEALDGVTNITARLAPLGVGVEDIRTTFIGFNTAAKLAGASSVEASNAFRQLAQALGSGRLQGDEFRSISEQIPTLLKPVADELGTTVGKLKEFSSQGKITSEVVIRALKKIEEEGAPALQALVEADPTQVFKNFQNEVERLQIAIGKGLLPATKGITVTLTGLIEVVNTLPAGFISIVSVVTAGVVAFTALKAPMVAIIGTFKTLATTISLFTGIAGGPFLAALAGITLAVTGITGYYIEQNREAKKLQDTLKNGTEEQLANLQKVKEAELEALQEKLKNQKRGASIGTQQAAKLKEEIEQLEKRNKQLKEFNEIMEKNKTYTVGEFTYDSASGKAIAGPGIKQEERKFEEGSSNQKAANTIKLLKQRVQIKQVEDDIDRQLLERQFEFQNKMEEAMGIEDEQLRLEKSRLLLKDYQIDRQEILNQKVKDQVSISKELGDTLERGLVENIKGAINGTQTFGQAMTNVLNNLKNKLMDRALSNMFSGIGDAVFGDGGKNKGIFGNILGGIFKKRAMGGPVSRGQSYIVGERGPELFTPNSSGTISPNSSMGSVNINVNVDASGSEVEGSDTKGNELGQQIAIAIQSEIIKQKRSGGLLAG